MDEFVEYEVDISIRNAEAHDHNEWGLGSGVIAILRVKFPKPKSPYERLRLVDALQEQVKRRLLYDNDSLINVVVSEV